MAILVDADATPMMLTGDGSNMTLPDCTVVSGALRTVEPSNFTLGECAVVDRNFVLPSKYLNAVESKVNQNYETTQRWIIGA